MICQGLKDDLVQRGVDANKITLIPNAVAYEKFTERQVDENAKVALAKKLNVDDACVLGFVGSFYAYEGLDLMLESMQELAKRDKKYVLLLVGGGPEDKRLKQMVADFGLEQNVIFTGRVPHDEVANYYDLIDLLVFPRKSMRLTELVTPLKPLEAMAQRKLVLASDVGGHHELITHGENGYLFKADNVADLTRNVEEITSTDNSEVLSNGLTFVKEVRNWAVSVSNYKPIYEALKKH